MFEMTPREIVAELDKHIVGQDAAKRAVAIALRNRWRWQKLSDDVRNRNGIPNDGVRQRDKRANRTQVDRATRGIHGIGIRVFVPVSGALTGRVLFSLRGVGLTPSAAIGAHADQTVYRRQ